MHKKVTIEYGQRHVNAFHCETESEHEIEVIPKK